MMHLTLSAVAFAFVLGIVVPTFIRDMMVGGLIAIILPASFILAGALGGMVYSNMMVPSDSLQDTIDKIHEAEKWCLHWERVKRLEWEKLTNFTYEEMPHRLCSSSSIKME